MFDNLYGNREDWLSALHKAFDSWSEVSNLVLELEPNDDGAPLWSSPGKLGVRGDIRFGGMDESEAPKSGV